LSLNLNVKETVITLTSKIHYELETALRVNRYNPEIKTFTFRTAYCTSCIKNDISLPVVNKMNHKYLLKEKHHPQAG